MRLGCHPALCTHGRRKALAPHATSLLRLYRYLEARQNDLIGLRALLVGALSLFLLAGAETEFMMLLSGAVGDVALGGVQVSIVSLIVERAPPDSRPQPAP
jgi:hypothetical protein